MQDPMGYIDDKRVLLDYTQSRLVSAAERIIADSRKQYIHLAASLDAMSPLKVLSRGYSVTVNEQGKAIYNSSQIKQGDILKIKFKKGSAECKTLKIEE